MKLPSYTVPPGKKVRLLREIFFEESRSKFASRCYLTEAALKNIENGYRSLHKGPPMIVITSMVDAAGESAPGPAVAATIRTKLRHMFLSQDITEEECSGLLEYLKTSRQQDRMVDHLRKEATEN